MLTIINNIAEEEIIVKNVVIFESEKTKSGSTSWSIVSCCIADGLEDGTVGRHHVGNGVRFFQTKYEVWY